MREERDFKKKEKKEKNCAGREPNTKPATVPTRCLIWRSATVPGLTSTAALTVRILIQDV